MRKTLRNHLYRTLLYYNTYIICVSQRKEHEKKISFFFSRGECPPGRLLESLPRLQGPEAAVCSASGKWRRRRTRRPTLTLESTLRLRECARYNKRLGGYIPPLKRKPRPAYQIGGSCRPLHYTSLYVYWVYCCCRSVLATILAGEITVTAILSRDIIYIQVVGIHGSVGEACLGRTAFRVGLEGGAGSGRVLFSKIKHSRFRSLFLYVTIVEAFGFGIPAALLYAVLPGTLYPCHYALLLRVSLCVYCTRSMTKRFRKHLFLGCTVCRRARAEGGVLPHGARALQPLGFPHEP